MWLLSLLDFLLVENLRGVILLKTSGFLTLKKYIVARRGSGRVCHMGKLPGEVGVEHTRDKKILKPDVGLRTSCDL